MISIIKKGISTLKEDGFIVFIVRIYNYTIVKLKRLFFKKDKKNILKWLSLKNKYQGKRIFILGNGPSLNKTELYLLKNEYTMCFNRINLMLERLNWIPNFFAVTDDLLIGDMHAELKKEIIPIVDNAFFPDLHPSNVDFKKYIGDYENVYYLNTDLPEFSLNLPKCGIKKTVVNAGLQIAAYMGFKEIYVLGVDLTFTDQKVKKNNSRNWKATKDDDPNHFDPRYFGSGRSYHNPSAGQMGNAFIEANQFFNNNGIKVYNAGIGGRLDAFERIEYNSLFNYSNEEKELLFMEMINIKNINNFNLLEEKYKFIDNVENYSPDLDTFLIPSDIVSNFIKASIFSHIPFGPFKGKYVFKKRIL
jgi:hypothetical protein